MLTKRSMSMLKDLHMAHLTGTATVVENGLFVDRINFHRNRRTVGQMFLNPMNQRKSLYFAHVIRYNP